jgi:hypothetical protein
MGCQHSQTRLIFDKKGFSYIPCEDGNMNTKHVCRVTESELPNNSWLLSPIYRRNDNLLNDYQPGIVTGTCKYNESYKSAVKREILEELAVSVFISNIFLIKTWSTGRQKWKLFHITLDNLFTVSQNDIDNAIKLNNSTKDNKSKKIMVILHGSKSKALQIIKSTSDITRGEKDIIGTHPINLGSIRKLVKSV